MAGNSKRFDKGDSVKEGLNDGLCHSLISFLAARSILFHVLFCWKGVQEGKLLTCLRWQILPAWSGTLWVEGNLCSSWEQPEWSSWSAETDEGSSKSVTKTETGKLVENKWNESQEPNETYSSGDCYSPERFWKPLGWSQHFKKEKQGNMFANPSISNVFYPKDLRSEVPFSISLSKLLLSGVSKSTSVMMESVLGVCGVL